MTRNIESDVDIRDGRWHHLAAVGNSRNVKIYIDGSLDAESVSYYVFMARPPPSFEMFYYTYGRRYSKQSCAEGLQAVADNDLQAQVDEVIFWNEDRSREEILRHMNYGLMVKDIRSGLRTINPLPEFAVDDGNPHRDLVSYLTFDGQITPPFINDKANETTSYRMLPLPGGAEILANTRPPIFIDRMRALPRKPDRLLCFR